MAKSRRHNPSGRSSGTPRFIQIDYWVLETPAARALSGTAFKVLFYVLKRFNGVNNGSIGFGSRSGCFVPKPGVSELADLPIGVGKSTMTAALAELETAGFIRCTRASTFDQKRRTREWRITWLPTGQGAGLKPPTKEFVMSDARVSKRGAEKQNAGPQTGLSPNLQDRRAAYDLSQVIQIPPYRTADWSMSEFHRTAGRTHLVNHPSTAQKVTIQ